MSIGRVVRPFRTFVRLLVKRDPVAGQKYSTSQVVPACSGGHFVFVWSLYGRERKNGASTCDLAEITSLFGRRGSRSGSGAEPQSELRTYSRNGRRNLQRRG